MNIRKMTIEDYDAVAEVWSAAELEHRLGGRDSREATARQLVAMGEFMFVAEDDGRIVGVVIGSFDNRKAYVNRLAVLPEIRRQGVARALVARVEKAFDEAGIPIFSALVYADNDASMALLESMGYKLHNNVRYYAKRIRPDV